MGRALGTNARTSCLTSSSHYLNQCWLITSEVLWYSPRWKNSRETVSFILNTSLQWSHLQLPGINALIMVIRLIWLNEYNSCFSQGYWDNSWTNFDQNASRLMASLRYNELINRIGVMIFFLLQTLPVIHIKNILFKKKYTTCSDCSHVYSFQCMKT